MPRARLANRSERASPVGVCPEFAAVSGLSRRAVLRAGALGYLGLSLPRWLGQRAFAAGLESPDSPAAAPSSGFGQAKSCIFFFMWGGPSQLDTFDMKPAAPAEVRGGFQPIATTVPGTQICEHFTALSRHTDKLAIVRSLCHRDPAHLSSGHATLTGHWAPVINSDAAPPSQRDTPHIGAVVSRVRPATGDLPNFVTLPWQTSHPAAPGGQAPGQHGGWLGRNYDPLLLTGDPSQAGWTIPELTLGDGLTLPRMENRHAVLREIDRQRGLLDASAEVRDLAAFQQRALGLVTSARSREAFDLEQEPPGVRERYGRNIHGQCALLARRLIERGVALVSVNWHNDGRNFWDTHGDNFNRLKKDLIPPADRALSALLDDLTDRGLLEETLLAWVGEFGRKPQISQNVAGREHWPYCYSGLLAGGGVRGGAVFGASDKHASRPVSNPVSPLDYAATIYHALGIRTDVTLTDMGGRPQRYALGEPIRALFS